MDISTIFTTRKALRKINPPFAIVDLVAFIATKIVLNMLYAYICICIWAASPFFTQNALAYRAISRIFPSGKNHVTSMFVHNVRVRGPNVYSRSRSSLKAVADADSNDTKEGDFDIKAWFNPNTRGGVIVWSFLLLAFPIGIYNYFVSTGMEDTKVGGYVGALFVLLSNLLWASTYIFRVANKDMTYAKQLRDYENAVLQKRLDELADDEIDALMQEISTEDESADVGKPQSFSEKF